MVCKKCEKKTTKLATTDPFQASTSKTRVLGENKLLASKRAARASPYVKGGRKCVDCPVTVQQVGGTRCQKCAYKKGEFNVRNERGSSETGGREEEVEEEEMG
ncbi:hypothetical protein QFC21_003474 [Naganishia friedmannii]|uniref:Uncharacterized protein n=1 Tax=Naganishia friedmannii TaxID=89922 RepID=A0ACC2VQ86_9TREE|nr:hypothetical protein QFC21_003474 [Naganishia friedmannii]